jgi:hypothetical protein
VAALAWPIRSWLCTQHCCFCCRYNNVGDSHTGRDAASRPQVYGSEPGART